MIFYNVGQLHHNVRDPPHVQGVFVHSGLCDVKSAETRLVFGKPHSSMLFHDLQDMAACFIFLAVEPPDIPKHYIFNLYTVLEALDGPVKMVHQSQIQKRILLNGQLLLYIAYDFIPHGQIVQRNVGEKFPEFHIHIRF